MIKPLTGHENCRGRPPTQGDCREGPIDVKGFGLLHSISGIKDQYRIPNAYTALAVKRRWGEKVIDNRPRDNIILPGLGGYGIRDPQTGPAWGLPPPYYGLLHPGRMFPPWKPVKSRARDWVGITCTGEPNRKPVRHNHTCSSPETITAAIKRPGWIMPCNEKKEASLYARPAVGIICNIIPT